MSDVRSPRWIAITGRLPEGWCVRDVLEMPQFQTIRVGARSGNDSVDVPIKTAGLTAAELDGAIVGAVTSAITKRRASVTDR